MRTSITNRRKAKRKQGTKHIKRRRKTKGKKLSKRRKPSRRGKKLSRRQRGGEPPKVEVLFIENSSVYGALKKHDVAKLQREILEALNAMNTSNSVKNNVIAAMGKIKSFNLFSRTFRQKRIDRKWSEDTQYLDTMSLIWLAALMPNWHEELGTAVIDRDRPFVGTFFGTNPGGGEHLKKMVELVNINNVDEHKITSADVELSESDEKVKSIIFNMEEKYKKNRPWVKFFDFDHGSG